MTVRYFSIYLICVISLIISLTYGQSKSLLSHSTIAENLEWKGVAVAEENTAIIPASSQEDRASAAGWANGGNWMNQHEDINQIGKTREIDLVFLGNSITQSWGGEGRHVWPVGEKIWREYYKDRNTANFGISGDRTQQILWRIAHGNFDTINPKVIVLLIGTNNLVDNTALEIIAGINTIVADLRINLPETKILLMGILPRGEKSDDPFRIKINQINAVIKYNEDQKHVFFINIEKALLNPDGTANKRLMADDCLHLKTEGYKTWAEEIEPVLEKLLSY